MCYVLKPLANPKSTLYVPVDSEALLARIRPVLTPAEILAMIEDMPAAETLGSRDERGAQQGLHGPGPVRGIAGS